MLRHKHFTQDVDKVRRRGTGIRDLEVRKQDVIGEQWSPGMGKGTAEPAGLKGSIRGCQVPPLTPQPPFPGAAMPVHPTRPSSSGYPCPANTHPPHPKQTK